MRTVLLASVRTYARRYVAAAVAIVVGVAFIVTTNALASAARDGMLADLRQEFTGTDLVVTGFYRAQQVDRVLDAAAEAGAVAAVNADLYAPVSVAGRRVSDDAAVGSVAGVAPLRWQQLTAGRFPARPGEALADVHAAEANHVAVGDLVTVGAGATRATVRVTGLAASSSGPLAASLYLTWPDLKPFGNQVYAASASIGCAGTDDCAAALRAALPDRFFVQPVDDHLQQLQREVTQGVDVIAVLLLIFAAIAFFVSALVIANTFSILLAQRARDFALLRCVGATRRQVLRSVRTETLTIGAGAATLGVLAGVGAGHGLTAVAAWAFPSLPLGAVSLSPWWLIGAWATGVLVTGLAGVVPARRSTRVSPLAALRPVLAVDVRTAAGRWRIAGSLLVAGAGAALLASSMTTHSLPVMIAGGMVSFVGVLLLGPVLMPALVRIVGVGVGRCGVPGALAAANALRNPRRTAATAASLLVGVTLISGLVVGMATVRSTVAAEMDVQYPVDATLTASGDPVAEQTLTRVRTLDDVADATVLDGVTARITGPSAGPSADRSTGRRLDLGELTVLGVDPAAAAPVVHGRPGFLRPRDDIVFLPWQVMGDHLIDIGTELSVIVDGRARTLTVAGGEGFGDVALVSAGTLRELSGGTAAARAVWVRAGAEADPADLRGALGTVAQDAGLDLTGGLEDRAFVDLQLDVMTGATIALLAVGVVIALIGIGNTLGLSVLERAREHALLRAMGLTRRQLRVTLALEAGMLALVAGLLGVGLGAAYAWVAVHAVVGEVLDDVSTVLPAGPLTLIVLVAAAAGLLACVLPARRAARVAPAQGLSAD